jgi:hypothetical protein
MVALTGHPMHPACVPRARSRHIRQRNNRPPGLPRNPVGLTSICTTAHTCHARKSKLAGDKKFSLVIHSVAVHSGYPARPARGRSM